MKPHHHLHQEAGPRGSHSPILCHTQTESTDGAIEGRSSWEVLAAREPGPGPSPSSATVNGLLATAPGADMLARRIKVTPGTKAILTQSTPQRLSLEYSSVQVSVCFWIGFVLCPVPTADAVNGGRTCPAPSERRREVKA